MTEEAKTAEEFGDRMGLTAKRKRGMIKAEKMGESQKRLIKTQNEVKS
ncbi:MAG: hypothetical protein K2O18_01310 [Oscillospiraceae bacterium]|nr:hypothetical protein [Oscillospiraceae bacterium]